MSRPRSDIEPRIVHAARTRFLEDGVDGASLRRIARQARTNIGMIYYYFPSKDDLFLAVVEEIYGKILADVEVTLKNHSGFEDRVREMYARLYAMSETEIQVIRLVAREALSSSARLARLIERFRRGHIALVLETVASGMREGMLDTSLHPALIGIATLIIGGVPTVIQRVAADRLAWVGLPTGDEFHHQLLHILLHGVSAKTPAANAANRTTEE